MKGLLWAGMSAAAITLACAWTQPMAASAGSGGRQAAAQTAQDKNGPQKTGAAQADKKAADKKKGADQKVPQAKPPAPPTPSVPADYKALMDASTIADPAKRAEAVRAAIMTLYSKQMSEAPDRKAFNEALRQSDPAKKVESLQKFIKDFPKSSAVSSAQMELLVALFADGRKKALDQANAIIDAAPESGKAMTMNNVADKFMVAEVWLDEAEKIINRSLAAWDEKAFIAQQKKSFEDYAASMAKSDPARKPPAAPSDDQLRKDFLAQKSYSQTTQGEIFLKQKRTADAERVFKEIYVANPSVHAKAMAAGYLADLAKSAGRSQEAFDYLMVVLNANEMTPARRKDLEDAYRKTHSGTLDGYEAMLDAVYEKNNPKPAVTPYVAPKTRSDRVVLAEIFTGSGCPPCVGADLAFEGALNRYKVQDLAVLMYHLHIPAPDPMTNPSTQARSKFYNVNGVPSFYIDGETDGRGGGGASAATTIYKDRVEPVVDTRLTTKADVKLALQATVSGSAIGVKVEVGKPKVAAKNLKLQVALVEERINYAGENGVRFHPMVVRSLAGPDAAGFALDAKKAGTFTWTFDIPKIVAEARKHLEDFEAKRTSDSGSKFEFAQKKHDVDANKLLVVAFVQDEDTKKVLQAATFRVGPARTTTHWP